MSEYRQDPITKRWMLLAPERAARPHAFATDQTEPSPTSCPFCRGHEDACLPPLLSYPPGSTGGPWTLRVVPNLYPAVTTNFSPDIKGAINRRPAYGHHEVVIESAEHKTSTVDLTVDEIRQVFRAYQDRFQAWQDDSRVRWGLAFKNDGRMAGASLEHIHSQLLSITEVPPQIEDELRGATDHFESHGRCVYCELIERELRAGERIVGLSTDSIALCPFASRVPYEITIMPREHCARFERTPSNVAADTSVLLLDCVKKLHRLLPQVAINYVIHTSPFDTIATDHYHWHIELLPRVAQLAGFEWGAGQNINIVPPEQAAQQLQSTQTG